MIGLDELKTLAVKLQALSQRNTILYKNGLDLINYENDYYEVFDLLFVEIFNPFQKDWWDWWWHENNFGEDKNKVWINDEEIIYTWETFYELLKESK